MSQKVVVGVVFVAAMFMSIMDATIVNVALPTIGRDFGVSATAVDSISIAYLVSLAVFIPASGWLGDRFGGKRVMLTAIVVFTAASALCGLASSLGELVAFRDREAVLGQAARPGQGVAVSGQRTAPGAPRPSRRSREPRQDAGRSDRRRRGRCSHHSAAPILGNVVRARGRAEYGDRFPVEGVGQRLARVSAAPRGHGVPAARVGLGLPRRGRRSEQLGLGDR